MLKSNKFIPLFLAAFLLTPPLALGAWIDAQERIVVKLKATEDDTAGAEAQAMAFAAVRKDIEPGGPWLGIQFGPVPKPVAAHLNLDSGVGQMVLNVIEGSPADAAGFQQYDVITRIDGEATPSDIGEFMDVVQGFAPNDTHGFTLIRGGREVTANVTVGARPEATESWTYKFESEPDELLGSHVFRRGMMLEKDDQGNWNFHKLPHLDNLDDFLMHIPQFDPNADFSWNGQLNFDAEKGKSVNIERNDDGQFTVTVTEKENGNETTNTDTYANEQEFEQNDPDTFRLYKKQFGFGGGMMWTKRLPRGHGGMMFQPDDLDIDMDELHEKIQESLKHLDLPAPGGIKGHRFAPSFIGKPKTSFEINADGSIRVTTRQGGKELVETFPNADALKQSRPKLYEQYEDLQNSQGE